MGIEPDDASPGAKPTPSARVVLAEQDPELREQLRDMLAGHGYGVTVVSDGRSLLRSLIRTLDVNPHGFVPEVIILEVRMPGFDGLEIVRALQRTQSRVPVVLMCEARDEAAARRVEPFDLLVKPFELDALLETVGRALAVVLGQHVE